MELLTASHPEDPALDMALTHALLRGVAAGRAPDTARVFLPGPSMSFGRLDVRRPGFGRAAAAAAALGWEPVVRLGGGHVAAYDAGSVVVELVTATPPGSVGIQERFASGTALLVGALADCGVDPEVGELPGEYCPGRWSIHLRGGPKVAGAAQRVVRGAALFTAVVVVEGGPRIREALVAVQDALGVAWDPATAGAAEDGAPGLRAAAVAAALVRRLDAPPAEPSPTLLAAARELRAEHLAHAA